MFILVYTEDKPEGLREDSYYGCFATADAARAYVHSAHHPDELSWVILPPGFSRFESFCLHGEKPLAITRAWAGDTAYGLPKTFAILEFP